MPLLCAPAVMESPTQAILIACCVCGGGRG